MQPGEIVHRPDPGLARGLWEAPPWLFALLVAIALAVTLVYVLVRTGRLKVTRARALESRAGDAARTGATAPHAERGDTDA